MALIPNLRVSAGAAAAAVLLAGPACVDIVGSDVAKHVERDERHFTTTGKPDVSLSTFDGAIEIRPWDKHEVQVIVEKRAVSKEAADAIEVRTEQHGNRIVVDVKAAKRDTGFGLHLNNIRSAKLIVSLPESADVSARSGDGSIDIERVAGRLELRSGDGSIQGRELKGAITAHTGDGSIRLEGVDGTLDVDSGDGSITAAGTFGSLRAKSGDGSITIHARGGSAPAGDWDITTGDGSVTIELPDGFGADVDAHTGDGSVHVNGLPLTTSGSIGKNTLKGRLGAGGPKLRVRTGDGSITLKRS